MHRFNPHNNHEGLSQSHVNNCQLNTTSQYGFFFFPLRKLVIKYFHEIYVYGQMAYVCYGTKLVGGSTKKKEKKKLVGNIQ